MYWFLPFMWNLINVSVNISTEAVAFEHYNIQKTGDN